LSLADEKSKDKPKERVVTTDSGLKYIDLKEGTGKDAKAGDTVLVLARANFPGLSAKTIARIERGDTGKPHGKTLAILAKKLGVKPDEIETY
jgi:transcriptional regulator with XRE-family HTH domain